MNDPEQVDRRSSLRVPNSTPGDVMFEGSDKRIPVDVVNLGVSGFQIISDVPFPEGQVTFFIEGESYLCEIAHVKQDGRRFRIGLTIVQWLGWENDDEDDDMTVVLNVADLPNVNMGK